MLRKVKKKFSTIIITPGNIQASAKTKEMIFSLQQGKSFFTDETMANGLFRIG